MVGVMSGRIVGNRSLKEFALSGVPEFFQNAEQVVDNTS
jgi:hypothetical protein